MTEIAVRTTLLEMVKARDLALDRMRASAEATVLAKTLADEAKQVAAGALHGFAAHIEDTARQYRVNSLYHGDFNIDAALREYRRKLDADFWTALFGRVGISRLMSSKDMQEHRASLASGDVVPFTIENVESTALKRMEDAPNLFRRGLAETFSMLDRRFRSHDGFKVGGRIVIDHLVDGDGYLRWDKKQDMLADIERALLVLDGKKEMPGAFVEAIKGSRRGGYGPRVTLTQNDYCRIRIHKNGNAHLWFERPDLVEKVNQELAKWYGEVLADAAPRDFDETDLKPKAGLPAVKLQFYRTEDKLAARIVEDVGYHIMRSDGRRVLEPSAGDGSIVNALLAINRSVDRDAAREGITRVDAVEIDPTRCAALDRIAARDRRLNVIRGNFLQMPANPVYTAVVMNPPFYGTHYMDHVLHAFDFLAEDGVLKAILPATVEFLESKRHAAFRAWVDKMKGSFSSLPPESFASSGTRVNTVTLTVFRR